MSDLVVITGATGGVGQSVARQLAANGWVPIIGHRTSRTKEARAIADSCGGVPIELDMCDSSSIDRGLMLLAQDGRDVVGAVLAASPPPVLAPFGRVSAEDHSLFWTANVVGPHYLLAGLNRRFFRPKKAGSVVAILTEAMRLSGSECAVPVVMPSMGAYAVSKFGLLGVIAQLKAEAPWLRVCATFPGFTETKMLDTFDDRFLDRLRQQRPFSTPEEVATEVVERLALNENK